MKKKIGCLAAVLGLCLFMTTCYLFYFSQDSDYYRIKFGLARGAPFRIHGKIIDQYGNGVPMFDVGIVSLFGADTRRWGRGPGKPFYSITNERGEFTIDTGVVRLPGAALDTRTEHATFDGQFVHLVPGEWNMYFLDADGRWMRDARAVSPVPLPHDDTKPKIIAIGRSGPPQRMIRFTKELKLREGDFPDALWLGVDVIRGEFKEGRCEECDFQLYVTGITRLWDDRQMSGLRYEFIAGKGAGIQIKKDKFGCESPPSGFDNRVVTQPIKENGKWQTDWKPEVAVRYPLSPELYFTSRDGQVLGSAYFKIEPSYHPHDLRIQVTCIANPRGEQNLNYGLGGGSLERSPLPLPVVLPFVEDVPTVNSRKVWAYVSPEKGNSLIVEGEKGAVEAGSRVAVVNRSLLGQGGLPDSVEWQAFESSHADGGFRLVLSGKEGDRIQIKVSFPKKVTAQNGTLLYVDPSPDERTVELAPRWRLKAQSEKR